jgi:LuxR family maltose regulon positive regulatory protein
MNGTEEIDGGVLSSLEAVGFVNYRSDNRRYYVHNVLQGYVKREFQTKPEGFRRSVLLSTARWHEKKGNNFIALRYYNMIDDFESILNINFATSDFTANASMENKALLLSVLDRCPKELAARRPGTLVVFAFALFIYNEAGRLSALCEEARACLESGQGPDEERARLSGELEFLTAFLSHNDFEKMAQGYRRAFELMGGPTSIINPKGPWTFGSPSVLFMFWRGDAEADTRRLEENLKYYQMAANGHGTGADSLMRAELLFNQGKFWDSEIAAHRAAYAADEAGQLNIHLCALFLLAQLAVARGSGRDCEDAMDSLKEKAERSRSRVHITMSDLCRGFLNVTAGGAFSMPGWLQSGEISEIQSRVRFMTRPYADIIFSKSLLAGKKYTRLIGVGDMLRAKASHYPNALALVYIDIHLAAACAAAGENERAATALSEALGAALPGRVLMPFAQNFAAIQGIAPFKALGTDSRLCMARMADAWERGVENLQSERQCVLSRRESEVAALVSRGLTNQSIADKLFLSPETIKTTLSRAFEKTGTSSRTELAAWLMKNDKNSKDAP